MSFIIIRRNNADGSGERILLPPEVATRAQAEEKAASLVERYAIHGFDAKQAQWWGRDDEHGRNAILWIELGS